MLERSVPTGSSPTSLFSQPAGRLPALRAPGVFASKNNKR